MRTFFKLSLCVFLFGFSVPVIAQQPFAKTLLWRISGNGLKKPSYLFGTMHLTDKRLFNFTDSVYRAIETSDGLAIEVNPDEMMAYIINKTFDQLGKGKSVKDILGNKDYNKYSAPLAKKFGKPADEITTSDLMKEKNKWMTEYLEKGEMPTFVDGYLYGIAKKQGKWIGGIEDVADQANVLDDLIDKSDISYILADKNVEPGKNQQPAVNDGVETMITAYTSQDINAIENITEASTTTERKDILLIHRNIKMARRIDSLAALRTMFFAIGAAHLPGDSGVIRLLQARGFTVEPVMSNKKIAAASYKFKEVETPWVEVKDEQGSYSVSMPGNPVDLKLFGILKMKFLFDITNFSGFYTMSATGPRVFINNDSTYTAFTDRMFRGQPITSEKKLEKNGVKGREYAVSLNGVSARVQIFLKDRTAFVAMVYALKKETTSSPATEKFFRSFIINPGYTPQIAGNTVFSDSIMGISFSSPVTLVANTNISRQDNNGWKISALNNTDPATGNFIMLSSKEVIAGRYISNDSLVYGGMNQFLQLQYDNIKYSDTVIQ
ncbi:MAG TPA: TraB/GumN family protein, partial [Chitinophagaceae bacterium]|nr:TraB/GumN family protein [Chitinophagaceae bacterium]